MGIRVLGKAGDFGYVARRCSMYACDGSGLELYANEGTKAHNCKDKLSGL